MSELIIYSSSTGHPLKKLKNALGYLALRKPPIILHTVDTLAQRLIHRTGQEMISVLLLSTLEELTEIVAIKHLFQDVQVILILPKSEDEIANLGLTLSPRFYTFIDADYFEIAAVLKKMLDHDRKIDVGEVSIQKEFREDPI